MAKKKSNHGGARQGAGSLPRLDKVGNYLRIVRLEADGSEAEGFAKPLYRVIEKGRGWAVLEGMDGSRLKMELDKPLYLGGDSGLHHADVDAFTARLQEQAAWEELIDYDSDTPITEED